MHVTTKKLSPPPKACFQTIRRGAVRPAYLCVTSVAGAGRIYACIAGIFGECVIRFSAGLRRRPVTPEGTSGRASSGDFSHGPAIDLPRRPGVGY